MRINVQTSVTLVNMKEVHEGNYRSVAMDGVDSFGGTIQLAMGAQQVKKSGLSCKIHNCRRLTTTQNDNVASATTSCSIGSSADWRVKSCVMVWTSWYNFQ